MAVQVAAVLPLFLFGGLAVQIADELGMSVSAIGWVSGIYFAVSAITTVPSGRLVDRFGALVTARDRRRDLRGRRSSASRPSPTTRSC